MSRLFLLGVLVTIGYPAFEQDIYSSRIVYQVPAMQKVIIKEKLPFRTVNDTTLTFDIYYPPGFNFRSNLPLVIFNNGVGSLEIPRWGVYKDWARLIAAGGMIAINHQSRGGPALEDCESLVDYLRVHASELNIDPNRIGLWACSTNTRNGTRLAYKTRPNDIKALVIYYGVIDSLGELRQDLPLFLVRAGLDAQGINIGMENFVQAAMVQDIRFELINYLEGIHAFDIYTNTDESREIIRRTVAFLKNNLTQKNLPEKKFVLTNRNFMWLVNNNQLDRAMTEFRKAREMYRKDSTFNPFYNGVIREDALNANGYWLLDNHKQKEALEVFKLMVESYPASANAYDGLSEAYEILNNKDEAIRNAEKCIDLLNKPNLLNAQFAARIRTAAEERLKRLK
jgi:tetratricopeptide (TPR) repeat protein